ncbi:MAG: hypothetical protein J1E80_08030 [Desulfovibrionaceae bacterium]|nr:hypothetical protein [Desulfovibrionaceae bacterium]
MLEIPVEAYPNQSCLVTLPDSSGSGQNCTVALYQRGERVYLDLNVDGSVVRRGAVCLPRVGIVGDVAGFSGELFIVDSRTQPDAQEPPQWQGLGTRWKLYYLTVDEVNEMRDEAARAALLEGIHG